MESGAVAEPKQCWCLFMLRKPVNKQSHATNQSELHFYHFLQIREPSQSEHLKNETPQRTPLLFPCHCQVPWLGFESLFLCARVSGYNALNHAGLQHARVAGKGI